MFYHKEIPEVTIASMTLPKRSSGRDKGSKFFNEVITLSMMSFGLDGVIVIGLFQIVIEGRGAFTVLVFRKNIPMMMIMTLGDLLSSFFGRNWKVSLDLNLVCS